MSEMLSMRGWLTQAPDGSVRGHLVDGLGETTEIVGVPGITPEGKPGWRIGARLVEVPEDYAVPGDETNGIRVRTA